MSKTDFDRIPFKQKLVCLPHQTLRDLLFCKILYLASAYITQSSSLDVFNCFQRSFSQIKRTCWKTGILFTSSWRAFVNLASYKGKYLLSIGKSKAKRWRKYWKRRRKEIRNDMPDIRSFLKARILFAQNQVQYHFRLCFVLAIRTPPIQLSMIKPHIVQ